MYTYCRTYIVRYYLRDVARWDTKIHATVMLHAHKIQPARLVSAGLLRVQSVDVA